MENYLGRKIRELRRSKNLTQEQLADYLNISYQSVSKWETGTTLPDVLKIFNPYQLLILNQRIEKQL